jgi:hypothetical protein
MNEEMAEYVEKERSKRMKHERSMYEELQSRETELASYREMLRQREGELEKYKNQLKEEQLEREKIFRIEFRERDQLIESRERELIIRQKDIERRFQERFEEAEQLRATLQGEILRKETELSSLIVEAEREKERYREESRKAIESKSQKFVDSALQLLGRKEEKFHNIAKAWSLAGAISICSGIGFAIFSMLNSADLFHSANNSSLGFYLYTLFRGLIVVGLFGALARYSFVLSSSFMHESLKSGERLHAIKFGEFYLDAYGADAEWSQLKEAFEHWNISGQSAFSKNPSTTDQEQSMSKIISQALDSAIDKIPIKNQ